MAGYHTRWVRPEELAEDPERIAIREALAFGKAVYDVRTTLRLTVSDLAGRAGMSDDEIECIEEGGTGPPSPCSVNLRQPSTLMSALPQDTTSAPSGSSATPPSGKLKSIPWAASMVVLEASRRGERVPPLAAWSISVGIVATVGANLAHGLGHGPIGALVSARPAVALIGSLVLMMLVSSARRTSVDQVPAVVVPEPVPVVEQDVSPVEPDAPALERAVRDRHDAGHSQRAIARDLNIDRRKVKRIFEEAT